MYLSDKRNAWIQKVVSYVEHCNGARLLKFEDVVPDEIETVVNGKPDG